MESQSLHRGRLIDHLQFVVKDLEASYKFYRAIFTVLGVPEGAKTADHFWYDELFVSTQDSPTALGQRTGRVHLAFQAADRPMVDAAYRAALQAGGVDNGKAGPRDYHPGYYAGFFLDPDGNNIEVVYHGPAERSAKSVSIKF